MDRRRFLLTSRAGALAVPVGAGGQQTKIYRIGFLSASSASAASRLVEQFQQGLRELGYTEGQSIRTEYIPVVMVNVGDPVSLGRAASADQERTSRG
jgi:hypothetical protein